MKPIVHIIGGGMVGLAQACALANLPITIKVFIAEEPMLNWDQSQFAIRTCAINPSSEQLLRNLDAWRFIPRSSKASVKNMLIWQSNLPNHLHYQANKLNVDHLTTIVENRALVAALWQRAQEFNNIEFCCQPLTDEVLNADLVIGADGKRSWLRNKLDMACKKHDYHQQALVAVIKSEKPHANTAYQVFSNTGPLALLPLADCYHTAMVWSNDQPRATELLALSKEDFNRELSNAFENRLGVLGLASELKAIPLVAQTAKSYVKGNAVLIGDAAHHIHPLAGQGANLGLADVACLSQKIQQSWNNAHTVNYLPALLQYQRERQLANNSMSHLMTFFQQLFSIKKIQPLINPALAILNQPWILKQLRPR